jgi:hypothetical protein
MKKLITMVLMMFTLSFVFGAQPEHVTDQENVKVVKSLEVDSAIELKVVELNSLEVVKVYDFPKTTVQKIAPAHVIIATNYCMAKQEKATNTRPTPINRILAVPWHSRYRLNQKQLTHEATTSTHRILAVPWQNQQ